MHPSFERTWDVDDVKTELQSALDVVDALQPPDDLRVAVFNSAAALLTQRAQRQSIGLPLGVQHFGG